MEIASKIFQDSFSGGAPTLLAIATVLTLIWQASGFAIGRQWALLIPYIGIIGLGGFLVNPIADNQSTPELIRLFASPSLLNNLCIVQLLIVGGNFLLTLKAIQTKPSGDMRWWFSAGFLLSLPSPVLITSLLAIEHRWLTYEIGARPEIVGISIGLGGAAFATFTTVILSRLPIRITLPTNLLSSLALVAILTLLPTTIQDLPSTSDPINQVDFLLPLGVGIAIATTLIALGFAIEWRQWRIRLNSPAFANTDTHKSN